MVNFKKNLKILVSYWREIIFLIIVVPIIFIGLTRVLFFILPGEIIGEKSNWVSFSGSYIAVIGAVGAVWLQIKNEKEKAISEKVEKELISVVSFLIIFRESCVDNYLFYLELVENYSEHQVKKDKSLVNKGNYKLKENLFLKFLGDIEIESRNRCIELYYSLERISYKYSILYYDNYFEHLTEFYLNMSDKTDEILGEYEEIKKDKKNYLDILSNRVFLDLTSLLEEINQFIKKIGEERNEKN